MIAKFKMELKSEDLMGSFDAYGRSQKNETAKSVIAALRKYLLSDGSLDASAIEKDWFPEIEADVFLSHSHMDQELVIRLAGYLYREYGLKCFIDSTVWGYSDNLLKQMDDKYNIIAMHPDGKKTYSYNGRNLSTAHVHMLLQGALAKMINKCECLIFVNTPNSIKPSDFRTSTYSPWIYSELLMADTFPPRNYNEFRGDSLEHTSLSVTYNVNLTRFINLTLDDLRNAKAGAKNRAPRRILEQLYLDKGIITSSGGIL